MKLHFKATHTFNIDDLEGGQPLVRGDISYFSLWLMMSVVADASIFKTFMDLYAPVDGL